MTTTDELIASLSSAPAQHKLGSPMKLALRIGLVLVAYAVLAMLLLKFRGDLALQFTRASYIAELFLLGFIAISSVWASVHLAFPDSYQHRFATRLPYIGVIAFAALLVIETWLPPDARLAIPDLPESIQCTICIAIVAVFPSALIFWLVRQGASVQPVAAGTMAVLAASAIGCFILRLIENNDSTAHLLTYHYIPTIIFAALGALLGKFLLRW